MRIAIIGRSRPLLDAASNLLNQGHQLLLVQSCLPESYYNCPIDSYINFCSINRIPFVDSRAINNEYLASLDLDVIISMNWPTRVRKETLEIPRFGVLNIHYSDLPRYQGNAPLAWTILNGDTTAAVTAHFMDENLDSGQIIYKELFPVEPRCSIHELYQICDSYVPQVLDEAIHRLTTNIYYDPHPHTSVHRSYSRRESDLRIDWTSSVWHLDRIIRASTHPFSGAYTFLETRLRLHIFFAEPYKPPFIFSAVPGQICLIDDNSLSVATSSRFYLLRISQLYYYSQDNESSLLPFCPLSHNISTRNRLV